MCDPITITAVSTAVAAAAAAAAAVKSSSDQNAYQKAQTNARNVQIAQNNEASASAYKSDVQAENNRQLEVQAATAQSNQAAAVQTMQASSALANSTTSAGIGGQGVTSLFEDYNRQQAILQEANNRNTQLAQLQANSRISGYGAEYQNRVNSLQPYISQPNTANILADTISGASAGASLGSTINGGLEARKNKIDLSKVRKNP
jgi:hypothetical protein